MSTVILAGDVGGTKTLLGLFDAGSRRPVSIVVETFETTAFPDLSTMIARFRKSPVAAGVRIAAASFGVAGPIAGGTVRLTNAPFVVESSQIARLLGLDAIGLVNDLVATAYGVTVLTSAELHPLQQGQAAADGSMAVIAAGTGLGEAFLHNVGGRFVPAASEAGHADFAPRTRREIEVMEDITARVGRASVEHVLSGTGLVNLYRVTHGSSLCAAFTAEDDPKLPADISASALERRCDRCVEALDLFVAAYGAEAGNLALRTVPTGGLFVAGGIAPRLLPALDGGGFMRAFLAKAPMVALLARIPVHVVLTGDAGLLGAAVHAGQGLVSRD